MIKINLLATERKVAKKSFSFQTGQKLTVVCTLILIGAVMLIGWRYWTIGAARSCNSASR
jgi:predicted negative regulator of RcsB-dependent stress response